MTYDFLASVRGGTISIADFRIGTDHLSYQGFSGDPTASQTVVGGLTYLALTNGLSVILKGITHLPAQ